METQTNHDPGDQGVTITPERKKKEYKTTYKKTPSGIEEEIY